MDSPGASLINAEEDLNMPEVKERKPYFSPANLIAISHFFSAWGDRMWMFAVGLYLVELTPNNLRLTAIYGLVVSFTVVLFGSTIGDWVDANARLKVVRISLVAQNVLVCMSALVILALMYRAPGHPVILKVCEASIIILGSLANLASQANTIAVERDWVVVISCNDKGFLADLNAIMRRIDLSCAILAPIAVGFIMTYISNLAGIIFICAWNILSFFAEYYLLLLVYRAVPRLAVKEITNDDDDIHTRNGSIESIHNKDEFSRIIDEDHVISEEASSPKPCHKAIFYRIRSFWKGWKVYFRQTVALAGSSLACIYLTVLGFSSVTTGYAYTQRLSGAILSACFAVGSLMGIVGTFLFPRLRKKFGLVRTGLISFWLQWSMLVLCVVSIWAPGSPSDMYSKHIHLWQKHRPSPLDVRNSSLKSSRTPVSSAFLTTIMHPSPPAVTPNNSFHNHNKYELARQNNTKHKGDSGSQEKFSYISISLLLTGLILSRVGLWMTDLTVTQLLQENVMEMERGIVSGTQNAFNSILDMMHYVLTIALPSPNQFGILTLISFSAISLGYVLYICFYVIKSPELRRRERGIGSVSSIEWKRDGRLLPGDQESKGLTGLEDDEEEIVRGTLTVDERNYESKQTL